MACRVDALAWMAERMFESSDALARHEIVVHVERVD